MPASASASDSSASRASAETCAVTLTTSASASVTSVAPSGSSTWPARIWVPAVRPSTETVMLSGMSVARTSSCRLVWSVVTTVSGPASPSRWTLTSTTTFSPLLHDDQVDVLDDRLDRVALDVLGQGELLLTVDDDGEQGVALLQGEHRLVAGEGDVHRLAAVAVHHGGDLVVAADLARSTLAELGAGLGDELVVGHVCSWGVEVGSGSRSSTRDVAPNDRRAKRPADPPDLRSASVDHGCVDRITRSDRTTLAGATSLAEATPRV